MDFIQLFMQIIFWIFLGITLLGLIKPWWVFWFLDFKNRLTVLRYYGIITLLLGLAVLVVKEIV
jgi:hypothetical protein